MKNILLIDNYDSFTYNLADYILQTGATCTVIRNDNQAELAAAFAQKWCGVVLSPGPCTPTDAGDLMSILAFFVQQKTPILGICLGHQAIGMYFGATLAKAKTPRHGKTSIIKIIKNDLLFANMPVEQDVMRYHSLIIIDADKTDLAITSVATDDGATMSFRHAALPIAGVQFHPESIGTVYGLQMIQNWVEAL